MKHSTKNVYRQLSVGEEEGGGVKWSTGTVAAVASSSSSSSRSSCSWIINHLRLWRCVNQCLPAVPLFLIRSFSLFPIHSLAKSSKVPSVLECLTPDTHKVYSAWKLCLHPSWQYETCIHQHHQTKDIMNDLTVIWSFFYSDFVLSLNLLNLLFLLPYDCCYDFKHCLRRMIFNVQLFSSLLEINVERALNNFQTVIREEEDEANGIALKEK